jgi:probable F420-dependent oxidoreductase
VTGVRWGVNLPLAGLPLRDHRALVPSLPDLGYTDVWTGEGGGPDALVPLAAAAAWSPGLRVGTGVLPVSTRGPAVLAQSAATLAELGSPVLLGIGSSVPAHVSALNGVPFDRPYARVRDTVRFLRRAFAGEVVDEEYETFAVHGFQLPPIAGPRPSVVVGALRPRMVRLGLQEGDGVVTNVLAPPDVDRVLAAAGERRPGAQFVVKVFVCPSPDAGYARAAGRGFLGWILNQAPYRAFHAWLGREEALAASAGRYDAGDRRAAAAALPDDLVDALWVHGHPDRCRELIERYVRPGVDAVNLFVAPGPGVPDDPAGLAALLRRLQPARVGAR